MSGMLGGVPISYIACTDRGQGSGIPNGVFGRLEHCTASTSGACVGVCGTGGVVMTALHST